MPGNHYDDDDDNDDDDSDTDQGDSSKISEFKKSSETLLHIFLETTKQPDLCTVCSAQCTKSEIMCAGYVGEMNWLDQYQERQTFFLQ